LSGPSARAGLTVDIHLYQDTYGYYVYPWLTANANTPNFPTGNYLIASPQYPTSGSQLQYQATNNTLNFITGGGSYYGDFNSFLYGITNGQWSIWVTNSTATNRYEFTVTLSGLTSDSFGAPAVAVFPINGAQFVTNQPLFRWTGPANWAGALTVSDFFIDTNGDYNYEASASLPPNQTSWACPVALPNGTNDFSVNYTSNITAFAVASVPLNQSSQPISSWTSTATMESDFTYDSRFIVATPASVFDATLVARYDFEQTNSPGTDSSGNGNNANCGGGNGGTNLDTFTTNSAVGTYARQFYGDTFICFSPGASCFNSLSNALLGSFSVTAWVKTTNSVNSDSANADAGAPVLFAYSSETNSVVPLSITGSKAAFTIYDHTGTSTTLHSSTNVNDGKYHLIAVTRNQTNGVMNVYVDGNLDGTTTGTTDPLFVTSMIYLAGGWYAYYIGLLDDVRIYSSALTANDVATLAGTTASLLGTAVNAPNLSWLTSGDTSWFVETTNTYDGVSAAQSGSVTNNQSTTLSVTVTGPGTVTFYWSSIANDTNGGFDYKFYIDDPNNNDVDDLSGDNDWYQDGPFIVPAGQHTLGWTVFANGDSDPTQAGFLDQVSYVGSSPVTLQNPQIAGASFAFQFLSQAGFTHDVQYRTNLISGAWQTYTSIAGDGSSKSISIPLSVFSPSRQGFIRISTQ
jgi:hypothetical protein